MKSNKYTKTGVVVLGNTKGVSGVNVHYLAKMIYSELKINKIKLWDHLGGLLIWNSHKLFKNYVLKTHIYTFYCLSIKKMI